MDLLDGDLLEFGFIRIGFIRKRVWCSTYAVEGLFDVNGGSCSTEVRSELISKRYLFRVTAAAGLESTVRLFRRNFIWSGERACQWFAIVKRKEDLHFEVPAQRQ